MLSSNESFSDNDVVNEFHRQHQNDDDNRYYDDDIDDRYDDRYDDSDNSSQDNLPKSKLVYIHSNNTHFELADMFNHKLEITKKKKPCLICHEDTHKIYECKSYKPSETDTKFIICINCNKAGHCNCKTFSGEAVVWPAEEQFLQLKVQVKKEEKKEQNDIIEDEYMLRPHPNAITIQEELRKRDYEKMEAILSKDTKAKCCKECGDISGACKCALKKL